MRSWAGLVAISGMAALVVGPGVEFGPSSLSTATIGRKLHADPGFSRGLGPNRKSPGFASMSDSRENGSRRWGRMSA